MTEGERLQIARERVALEELVRALDRTSWSSWQTTASFSKELDHARAVVSERSA